MRVVVVRQARPAPISPDDRVHPFPPVDPVHPPPNLGIPPGQIHKIFDPYYTTKSKGTGLGLAIVQKIIEAHGGRVQVSSNPGEGTSFLLDIPCNHLEHAGRQDNDA